MSRTRLGDSATSVQKDKPANADKNPNEEYRASYDISLTFQIDLAKYKYHVTAIMVEVR